MNQALRTSDFNIDGTQSVPLRWHESDLGPCHGCEYWSKCKAGKLACEAFLFFVSEPDKPKIKPGEYRTKAKTPSRYYFNEVFPMDTAPVNPLPSVTRAQVIEAIAANAVADWSCTKGKNFQSRPSWEAQQRRIMETLRQCLNDLQGSNDGN